MKKLKARIKRMNASDVIRYMIIIAMASAVTMGWFTFVRWFWR